MSRCHRSRAGKRSVRSTSYIAQFTLVLLKLQGIEVVLVSPNVHGQVDYIVKAYGVSTTGGFYIASEEDGERFVDQRRDRTGAHVQLGYTWPQHVQLAGRWAAIFGHQPQARMHEVEATLSWYPHGHDFKLQLDGGVTLRPDVSTLRRVWRTRAQVQLNF